MTTATAQQPACAPSNCTGLAQFPIEMRGASVDPKDYTWGTPSYPVLCQQFFQLQLLFAAQQQQGLTGGAPGSQAFAFPAPCSFATLPFAAGFLPAGGNTMMGATQPAGPAAPAPAPTPAPAAPSLPAPSAKACSSLKPGPKAGSKGKGNSSKAQPKGQGASKQQQQQQEQRGYSPEDFELDADEIRKLLEDADAFLPDLEESSLSGHGAGSYNSSEFPEQFLSSSPRDSCNNHVTDPFRTNSSTTAMDFDSFDLDLDALLPGEPTPAPVVARAPPVKSASCDLNNLQAASTAAKAVPAGTKPGKSSKTPKASGGGVQKAAGAKAAKGAAPHASRAAVRAAAAEEAALADISKLLDGEVPNRYQVSWDMDLVDTIDFANPFSTPVTVN